MTDVEHEYLVENEKLRAEVERIRRTAVRALTLAKESQDAASGRHDPWLDSALQEPGRHRSVRPSPRVRLGRDGVRDDPGSELSRASDSVIERNFWMANEMTLRIEIFPAELDAFIDFYVRVLRFEVDADRRLDPEAPYAAVRRGGTRIGALQAWRSVDPVVRALPQGVEIVLEVDDLEAEHRAVLDAAWPVAEGISTRSWGLRDFRLFDPDGHYLRITTRA